MESLLTIEAQDLAAWESRIACSANGTRKTLCSGSVTVSTSATQGPGPEPIGQGAPTPKSSTIGPTSKEGSAGTLTEGGEDGDDSEEVERFQMGEGDRTVTGTEREEGRESLGGEQEGERRASAIGAGGDKERWSGKSNTKSGENGSLAVIHHTTPMWDIAIHFTALSLIPLGTIMVTIRFGPGIPHGFPQNVSTR